MSISDRVPSPADPGYDKQPRQLQTMTVERVEPHDDGDGATIHTDFFSFGASAEVVGLLPVGKEFQQETINFSRITGYLIDGVWVDRRTDDQLAEDHRKMVEKIEQDRQALLDKNRIAWSEREAKLPEWIRVRLQNFHTRGGVEFQRDGWGYELIVAELAALYYELGGGTVEGIEGLDDLSAESPIMAFASEHGTSGNQHGFGKALAIAHAKDEALGETMSALSPLTGDPYYEGKGEE